MRVVLTVDGAPLAQAEEVTGVTNREALLDAALEALVEREAARGLARLGGSDPGVDDVPRRRSAL